MIYLVLSVLKILHIYVSNLLVFNQGDLQWIIVGQSMSLDERELFSDYQFYILKGWIFWWTNA